MDIAGLSTILATSNLQSQVSTAMLDKTLEMGDELGAGVVQIIDAAAMELSVNPHLGANIDMRI